MSNEFEEVETLESMVKQPRKVKKPSNIALWIAYVFFNVVILTFDIVAAGTVYAITKNWGYAILTFLAGFTPLMMHEFLYLRAYANSYQRWIAVFGAVCAVITVALVAALSAGVNLALANGYNVASGASEIVILLVIVGAALLHGVLAAVYFYIDPGIRAQHTEAETVAFHETRMKNIKRAEQLLEEADKARKRKAEIVHRHGGLDGKRAMEYLLNMLNDDDGDGIPNFLDKVDNRKDVRQHTGSLDYLMPPHGDRQHPDRVFARLPSEVLRRVDQAWLDYDNRFAPEGQGNTNGHKAVEDPTQRQSP